MRKILTASMIAGAALMVAACGGADTAANNTAATDMGNDTMMDANATDMGMDTNMTMDANVSTDTNTTTTTTTTETNTTTDTNAQ
ncbi:MAG TPA: hypothetical protein VEW71_02835 [Allosphingosinicella sp.]|nr:hypothetical protein [Allosphingosinicella sp.]